MSEHVWVQEHVAAYLAGGLDAQEAERLEAHARECSACESALVTSQQLDGALSDLFTSSRPSPELEDRAIARLWAIPQRPGLRRVTRWVAAVAAVLLLGLVGLVAGSLAYGDGLRMPGDSSYAAQLRKEEQGIEEAKKKIVTKANTRRLSGEAATADGYIRGDTFSETSLQYLEAPPSARPEVRNPGGGDMHRAVWGDNNGQPNAADTDTTALGAPVRVPANSDGSYTGDVKNPPSPSKTEPILDPAEIKKATDALRAAAKKRPSFSDTFDPSKSRPVSPSGGSGSMAYDGLPMPPGSPVVETAPTGRPPRELEKVTSPPEAYFGLTSPKPQPVGKADPAPAPEPTRRIVLRSGDIEFEIESFDATSATITKLVLGVKGAFIATVNSDKLTNGKVKGAITVRVPPEHLDGLVLDLRRELCKGGELKGVKLTSQDVTKTYTDLESRLKAARTMEQRLLQIIKEGKGEIKQLLEAEKELGVWRTKIEEFEGEIRYYANLAALSTLTITLTEREIKAAATITEREVVQAGVEVEDVDKAYQQLLAAIAEMKGRILKSELKQLAAGQFNAALAFEVAAESSGPIRDRLRMLGRVARLEIDRTTQTEGGTLPSGAKAKRGDTGFVVQLYNLVNVAPRETVTLQVAAPDVPAAYQALRDAVAKTTGRVLVSQLNKPDQQNVSAEFYFEVRRTDEATVRAALDAAGEELSRQVARAAETDSVTDTKVQYRLTLVSAGRLKPRETVTLTVEVADVDGAATLFAAQVAEVKGRQVDAKLDRDSNGRATSTLVFEVPLVAADGLVGRFKSAGTVRAVQFARDPQAPEGRYATARLLITVTNVEAIVPEGDGLWPKVRKGLSVSAAVLLTSVTWVVFGLCVVLPWAVIGFGGYRVVRRFVTPAPTAPAPVAPSTTPPTPA